MKKLNKGNLKEYGLILVLILLLISTIVNIEKKVDEKKNIAYTVKKEEVKVIELLNEEYKFSVAPTADDIEKYSVFVIQGEGKGEIGYALYDRESSAEIITGVTTLDDWDPTRINLDFSNAKLSNDKVYDLFLYPQLTSSVFVEVDLENGLYHTETYKNDYSSIYKVIILIISIVSIAAIFLMFKMKKYQHRLFILALFIGILMIFVLPPYIAPDELRHFARAYTISEGAIVCKSYDNSEKYYYQELAQCTINKEFWELKLISENNAEHWTGETNTLLFLPEYLKNYKKDFSGAEITIPYHGTAEINPVAYLPQIIFILIARLLKMNAITTFYMARLGNVICATLLLYCAVRNYPKYRGLFTILFFAPGMTFLRSTCSTDSILFGVVVLFISYVLRVKDDDGKKISDVKVYLKMVLLLTIIGLIKLPYILVAGILLLVRKEKFTCKKLKQGNGIKFFLIALMLIATVIVYGLSTNYLQQYSASDKSTAAYIIYLLQNFVNVVNMIIQTFFTTFTDYLTNALTYRYSSVLIIPYLAILLYFGVYKNAHIECEKENTIAAGYLFLSFILWMAILATFYILGPAPDIGYIWGVQGRYMLPILPLMGIGLMPYIRKNSNSAEVVSERYFGYLGIILWIHVLISFQSYWI